MTTITVLHYINMLDHYCAALYKYDDHYCAALYKYAQSLLCCTI